MFYLDVSMHIICDQAVIFHLRVLSGSNLAVNGLETKILDNWKENLATQMVLDEIIEALSFFDKDVTITRSPCELTAYRVLILVKLTPALK